ncbi:type I restriction enzyme HsdR N-terminal domain-containing protein [uncultured Aquimarina sp.]|uniref:type I restriction enzyme HsdR N-terminal domain-containing protein n=1 Tax=uncultured Aquimarina sp. TaxID=575652 RepID=UPI002626D836|nr:type I restriction enzyme HsdR N-terminal domain-containing protein [uncultured Aquimarina sp.]
MTEEEIRGNLLLPFLNDLGFDSSEISLEKSFSIRLGKSKHIVRGRSDILCKRNGRNLFVIELKNDAISITQEDIDQGISYARLLESNIAPFTIITNGKITKVFDSISKEELTGKKINQSSYWQNGCTLSTDIDLRLRYEALKKFVSFSTENLNQFCKNQVYDRMGTILGDINSPYSKFVKNLHIQRKNLLKKFNDFIGSDASIFGIVGSAGVGKTNAICSLALQSLEDKFVFFYNAALINKSPLEHIAQDLNLVFSSRSESDNILKKLDELGELLDKNILIFIDAIDESIAPNINLELSEISLSLRNMNKVKVFISCKSNIWENILKTNNTPTHLFEELNKFHDPINSLNSSPGFLLEDFSSEELKSIIPLYKSVFGFKGRISESLENELRNGFFLRIFSEVYSQKEIPQIIDDKELIKKYINQSLEKTSIGVHKSLRVLSKIGKVLTNHKYSSIETFDKEGVEIDNLLEQLDFSIDETIPEDLFSRNILIRSNKEDSYNVSFYYSKIRDYIICFHSYKLDKLNNEEFYAILETFYQNYIGQSAITFYIENASINHKGTLTKFKKDKALSYVEGYNSYLDNNFKKLKDKFDPKTNGDIGILLPVDILKKGGYALLPIDSNSKSKIQLEDLGDPFSSSDSNLFFERGVNTVYGSNESLLVANQNIVIEQNIFKQLKEVISEGRLNAYNSDILIKEQIALICYYYSKKLGYELELKDDRIPRFEQIYPIDLKDLKQRIYRFRAYEYYKRQVIGRIDRSLISEKAEKAIQENIDIPKLRITGDFPPIEELSKIVEILLEKGYIKLEEHHLPYPDKSIVEAERFYNENKGNKFDIGLKMRGQYSREQAKLYIETFFRHLESCYKEFVEYLFPTFKNNFSFYNTMPHEYFLYFKDDDTLKWGMFGYRTSMNGKISFNHGILDLSTHEKAFKEDKIISLQGFSLDMILYNDYYNKIKTIDKMNTPKVDYVCVLRNWVYRLIKNEVQKVFEKKH